MRTSTATITRSLFNDVCVSVCVSVCQLGCPWKGEAKPTWPTAAPSSSSSSFRPSSFSPPTRSLLCRAPRRRFDRNGRAPDIHHQQSCCIPPPPSGLGTRTVCRPPDRNFGRAGTERREREKILPPTRRSRFDLRQEGFRTCVGTADCATRGAQVSVRVNVYNTNTQCDEHRLGQPYQDLPSTHPFINSRHLAPWRQAGKASAAAVKDTERSSFLLLDRMPTSLSLSLYFAAQEHAEREIWQR